MEEKIRFSIIVCMDSVSQGFYRSFLESLAQSTYRNFELIVTDASGIGTNGSVSQEFFPEAGRLVYMRVRSGRTRGYALNYAISLARGDFFLIIDRHSRLSPIALFEMAKVAEGADIIYSDNDAIIDNDRMNPEFKCGPNIELLRHRNYIGDTIAISRAALKSLGMFRETLSTAVCYDMLLRAFEKKKAIVHVPKLLYSKRILKSTQDNKNGDNRLSAAYKEHMTTVRAHLLRMNIDAEIKPHHSQGYWRVAYDGSGYRSGRGEYLLLRDKGVRARLKEVLPRFYGHLKQDDVGIVGGAILRSTFTFDNCGYIYDKNGICYPACHGQSVFSEGYGYRCILPREVSAVDFGFCMIKKKVYKGLNGFDRSLSGREMMLDFCIRARRAGYRTVFEPSVKVRRRGGDYEPNIESNETLMAKWGELIESGDPQYNRNLPMGIDNYFLY